mgnify:CR=1 FL=1
MIINSSLLNSNISVVIYDMLGKEVATVINQQVEAGNHKASWDGKNYQGRKVTSGTYIYRIVSGEFIEAKKMLL